MISSSYEMSTPTASIECRASKDGRVTVMLIRDGNAEAGVGMAAADVGSFVATLLAAAMEASQLSGQSSPVGQGTSLAGLPCIRPTAIGLSAGEATEPYSLVIHAGTARIGFALPNPQELGQALLAASAPEGRPQ
jgi:hypothetical protein